MKSCATKEDLDAGHVRQRQRGDCSDGDNISIAEEEATDVKVEHALADGVQFMWYAEPTTIMVGGAAERWFAVAVVGKQNGAVRSNEELKFVYRMKNMEMLAAIFPEVLRDTQFVVIDDKFVVNSQTAAEFFTVRGDEEMRATMELMWACKQMHFIRKARYTSKYYDVKEFLLSRSTFLAERVKAFWQTARGKILATLATAAAGFGLWYGLVQPSIKPPTPQVRYGGADVTKGSAVPKVRLVKVQGKNAADVIDNIVIPNSISVRALTENRTHYAVNAYQCGGRNLLLPRHFCKRFIVEGGDVVNMELSLIHI